jgi:hypothetical protein
MLDVNSLGWVVAGIIAFCCLLQAFALLLLSPAVLVLMRRIDAVEAADKARTAKQAELEQAVLQLDANLDQFGVAAGLAPRRTDGTYPGTTGYVPRPTGNGAVGPVGHTA